MRKRITGKLKKRVVKRKVVFRDKIRDPLLGEQIGATIGGPLGLITGIYGNRMLGQKTGVSVHPQLAYLGGAVGGATVGMKLGGAAQRKIAKLGSLKKVLRKAKKGTLSLSEKLTLASMGLGAAGIVGLEEYTRRSFGKLRRDYASSEHTSPQDIKLLGYDK